MPKWNVDGQAVEADRSEIRNGHLMFWSRPALSHNQQMIALITETFPPDDLVKVFSPGTWTTASLEK